VERWREAPPRGIECFGDDGRLIDAICTRLTAVDLLEPEKIGVEGPDSRTQQLRVGRSVARIHPVQQVERRRTEQGHGSDARGPGTGRTVGPMKDADPAVRTHVADHAEEFVSRLVEWLRIPSISGDPANAPDVRRSAEWLAAELTAHGFPTVEVWETSGLPAVFAEWPSADGRAKTVLVYGHHDVQPVDPIELWTTPPFEPTREKDRLRGRGAADDKGQVLMHLLGLRAHLATTGRATPAVNLKLLVEGEEESGSPNFAALLREHRDRLACDVVVVSDTGMWSADVPSICTGMRGMTDGQVDFHGPDGDLHSGSFGGAVPNPLTELARVVGRLHDDSGRVSIPGFYDGIVPLGDRERGLIALLPFDESAFLADAQSRATWGEKGFSTLERIWGRPTAEVNGLWGGYTGPGHKTIVPSDAHAKISFRLVAGQEPARIQELFRAWIVEQTPAGITSNINFYGAGVRPCLTPLDDPALQAVQQSMSRAFDVEALYTREGGSGPEADLAEVLAAPVVFLGVGVPDDRIHAPNEKVEIPLLLKGAEAISYLWAELADGEVR
jgi:acetylornithine deacetylase/succinyl-diaminopimelate desuccinylase-like protein